MIFKTITSTALAGFIFSLASCAPKQSDPYDTGSLYGYPDAGVANNQDGSLYDVPADFEDGGAADPITASAPSTTYTVVRGDTLSKISKRHNVSMRSIIDANSISNPNLLRVGQTLTIPGN